MELHPERAVRGRPRPTADEGPGRPAEDALARLLLGEPRSDLELPAVCDVISAVIALMRGSRRKALLPLCETPGEIALLRRADHVLVSHYTTEAVPEVHVLDRPVPMDELRQACGAAADEASRLEGDPVVRQIAARLAERASEIDPDEGREPAAEPVIKRLSTTATQEPDSDVPLAFAFEASIPPGASTPVHPDGSCQSDLHALLFAGTLWAYVRGRRVVLARGPVMLAVHRMVAAIGALVDAWEAGRPANVRLRSGTFHVGVRLQKNGEVSVSLGTDDEGLVTAAALDVRQAALPVLRLASDIVRTLVSVDRSQSRNLRVRTLRDEVRTLRRAIKSQGREKSFENHDPDRLRASSPCEPPSVEEVVAAPTPASLRFSERWRLELDGLDASACFFCGDRLVVATPRHTLALARDTGEVLWVRDGTRTTVMMAETALLRCGADGQVELCNVEDGEPYAHARIAAREGIPVQGIRAGGRSIPPVAVLVEGGGRLVAIDLRTGEPRWRFATRGGGPFRMARAGRVLLVTAGSTSLHALDVATGEVVWRFTDRSRFVLSPVVCRDVVVASTGAPGGSSGTLHGIDLFSGRLIWEQRMDGAPAATAAGSGNLACVPIAGGRRGSVAAFEPRTGRLRWMIPDPGLGVGGGSLMVDRSLIINAPAGRLTALDLATGDTRWSRLLADPVADDVPRRLGPVLRGGALFVPAAGVHIVRPGDGSSIGDRLPCDLVPDVIRVDERGWIFVAEESGLLAAYAPVPHLTLLPGGR